MKIADKVGFDGEICCVCGKPAMVAVRDIGIVSVLGYDEAINCFPREKYCCDDHVLESRLIRIG